MEISKSPGSKGIVVLLGKADRSRTTTAGLLLIVMALALCLRVAGIREIPLRVDEQSTLHVARLPIESILSNSYTAQPPLYPILSHLTLFAGSDWLVRLPALFGGLLVVWVTFLGTRLFGDQPTSLFAATVATLSIYNVYYSQEARGYSLMSAFIGSATVLVFPYLREGRPFYLLAILLLGITACSSHYLAFPTFCALTIIALFSLALRFFADRKNGTSFPRTFFVLLLALAIGGLLLFVVSGQIALLVRFFQQANSTAIRVDLPFVFGVCGRWTGLGAGSGPFALAMAVWGFVSCVRKNRRVIALLILTAAPFIFFSFFSWPQRFEMRYLSASIVPFLILFSLGCWQALSLLGTLACKLGSPKFAKAVLVYCGVTAICALQFAITLGHAGNPRKYLPFLWTNEFGHRHVIFQSQLNPEMVENKRSEDFDAKPRNISSETLPLPNWPDSFTLDRGPRFSEYAFHNRSADDRLLVSFTPLSELAGVQPSPAEENGCVCWKTGVQHYGSAYTKERIGRTVLVAYQRSKDLVVRLTMDSSRLDLVDAYLEEVSSYLTGQRGSACTAPTCVVGSGVEEVPGLSYAGPNLFRDPAQPTE